MVKNLDLSFLYGTLTIAKENFLPQLIAKIKPKYTGIERNLHERRRRPFSLQRLSFGIHKEQSLSNIWKRVKILQMYIMHFYSTVWKPSYKKNVNDWPTKKKPCSIMSAHQLTTLQLHPQNC